MVRSFSFVMPYYIIPTVFSPLIVLRAALYLVENKIIYFYVGN